jgi:deoxyribose-phosphate aldolase
MKKSTAKKILPRRPPPSAAASDADVARRALALLDLTELSESCTGAMVETLCARAISPHGATAAVCLWPAFVRQAKARLAGSPVRVATVVNFPTGEEAPDAVLAMTRQCLDDGADEIDLVLPYRAFLAGDERAARGMAALIAAAVSRRALLKVILETGAYPDQTTVARASRLAIAAGADFIKTSTGKISVSATPEAARTMLAAIKAKDRAVGLKPSGGIRSIADARAYLALADEAMGPRWATAKRFRFGASGLLEAINAAIEGAAAAPTKGAY